MIVERKISINNKDYYLGFKIKYNQNKKVTKMDGSYFDFGDLSEMIKYFEKNYKNDEEYDKDISYMNDIIYLYDRFQFVEYIKDVTYNEKGNISQIVYIDRYEIIDYIKSNKIEINKWDKDKCICPMLYN